MMDDEKHKNEYNELRNECLCRGGELLNQCGIPTPSEGKKPYMIERLCLSDKYIRCPLFTFIKKMRKHG